jgi:mannose-1-phosphate guanylyltransferase
MKGRNENRQPWAILLAGGEGKRLASFTQTITGDSTRKQFCPLVGDQSMFEQTRSWVSSPISDDRIISVLTIVHERFYRPIIGETPSANLVIQPENRGTAPAILHAVLRIAHLDSSAQVALFPCDNFVDDDREFMRHVELALDVTATRPELPELTVLLGIAADRPETSYGWIESGEILVNGPVFSVRQFWEKPGSNLAAEFLRRGCLWNGSVIVARASTLLGLFIVAMPDLYLSFRNIQTTFCTRFEDEASRRLYDDLSPSSFSDDVLVRHGLNLGVLPITGVRWKDLGEPRRVLETLRELGTRTAYRTA